MLAVAARGEKLHARIDAGGLSDLRNNYEIVRDGVAGASKAFLAKSRERFSETYFHCVLPALRFWTQALVPWNRGGLLVRF